MFKLNKYIKEYIEKNGIENVSFFIRPYYNDTTFGLGQKGFTSDKYSFKDKWSSSLEYSSTDDNEYCFLNEFEIVAEFNFDFDFEYAVIGHVFGYRISSNNLFEDIVNNGGSDSFYIMDGTSHILYNFWENFKFICSNPNYEHYLGDVLSYEHNLYFATNISLAKEFLSPEMENLVLTKLIPNYYKQNGCSIYSIMRTSGETELTDNFVFSYDNYNYEKHEKTLIEKFKYTPILMDVDFPENHVEMYVKKIPFEFFQ